MTFKKEHFYSQIYLIVYLKGKKINLKRSIIPKTKFKTVYLFIGNVNLCS